jgi:hypothetical protein
MDLESIRFTRGRNGGRLAVNGAFSPEPLLQVLTNAVTNAVTRNLDCLIVDLTQASLTHDPSLTECHHAGGQLARCGAKLQGLAFVLRDECAGKVAFLCTVATNRGLRAASFSNETAARGWLGAAA